MYKIFHVKAYEQKHGPHFNEEYARKAVNKMENEDGTKGPHWSLEEATSIANQFGITFTGSFNKYDQYVALNMIYSDYYKVIVAITNSNAVKHFVEFAKAWLKDKDIDEGKMWYYYVYIMCNKIRDAEMDLYDSSSYDEDDDEEYDYTSRKMRMRRSGMGRMARRAYDDDYDEYDYITPYSENRGRSTRYVRY